MDIITESKRKIACVILNYNDAETTISLIQLIKKYEVIDYIVVVDNKSTDFSFEKLKKFQTEKIRVISSEKNGGYGYGNNIGIKYAKEFLKIRYILIANPDTKFEEEVVVGLKNLIIKNSNCIITAPEYVNGEAKVAWKILDVDRYVLDSSIFFFHLFGRKAEYNKKDLQTKNYIVDIVLGSLLLLDIDKFYEIGMYDEEFFLFEEEIVIATKARNHNYETRLLPKTNYQHIHSTTISKVYRSMVKQKRMILDSRLLYLRKYCGVSGIKLKLISIYFCLVTLEMKFVQVIYKCWRGGIKRKG